MEGNWNGASGENKYQYNGKEWNDDFGLGLNDYGARFYDPALGRFGVIDRFSEKYLDLNPYQYGANNPIKFIDVNGDSIELLIGLPYTNDKGEYKPYGHVALRVFNAAEGYNLVYDFGRYGKTYEWLGQDAGGGEGILNVYFDGAAFFDSEMQDRTTIGYSIATTKEQDNTIINFYYSKILENNDPQKPRENGVPEPNKKKADSTLPHSGVPYRLKEDYTLTTNNCNTMTCAALKKIGINWLPNKGLYPEWNPSIAPNAARTHMEANYQQLGLYRREYKKGDTIEKMVKNIKKW